MDDGVKFCIIIFPVEIVLIFIVVKFAVVPLSVVAVILLVLRLDDVILLTNAAEDPVGNPNVLRTPYPPSKAVVNVTYP
jgi:hypothetical protein